MKINQSEYKCIQFKESFYLGQIINNNASGQGILFCNDMHMYVGGFKNNKFHGQGFLSFPLKGFLFAEFWEGKVNGDVFWVNERMNYSKGNLYLVAGKLDEALNIFYSCRKLADTSKIPFNNPDRSV